MSHPLSVENHLGTTIEAVKEINIKEWVKVIQGRFWILVLLTALFTAAGGVYSMLPQTPLYEASTRVIVKADTAIMNTLKVMVREPVVMAKVVQTLALQRSPEALRGQINVSSVDNSQVMRIVVVDSNPQLSADIANTTAAVYKEEVARLLNFTHIQMLTKAEVSDNPQPVNLKGNGAIIYGFIFGLAIGIGLIFLLDSLDDSVKTEREIEQWLELPVLGCVTKITRKDTERKKNKALSPSLRGETIGS